MNCIKLSVIGFASASLLVGCVGDDPMLHEQEQALLAVNGLALNGMVANRVVATAVAENSLAIGRSGGNLQVNPISSQLLNTAEGRDYFTYIVSCAMPSGTVIETPSGSYEGALGLATGWETRAMTTSEKRWVSACLLARVNAYGISVEVSLRGDQPSLSPSSSELETFTLAEGAFYGNVFTDADSKMEMYACRGQAQAAGESGGLSNRDCAEPAGNGLTVCGFKYAGDCLDYTPQTPSAYACSYALNGYQDCHQRPSAGLWEPGSSQFEVITSYVSEISL